jgi:hypothetical protein
MQERLLCDYCFGAGVREHKGQLFSGVGRVGGGDDPAGVQGAIDDGRDVYVVEGVDGEDVALLPFPGVAEAFAEGMGGGFDGGVGVVAGGVEGAVDDWRWNLVVSGGYRYFGTGG